ncbi:MAG: DUF2254 domain-containing protein [Candidatus Limnocylindria bacterium]
MRFREWSDQIRHSLWFVPTIAVFVAAAFALALVAFHELSGSAEGELPFLFGAGPDGARAMLQAIAGSVITVAGVTFSITIVALQLTSSQFSPRVLRNFLRDRPNQVVLGIFMGTFTYALLVLRSIRSESDQRGDAFVPELAISGALILVFVSLGALIYFIHHISSRIQVTSIVASVARDTIGSVRSMAAWTTMDRDRGWKSAVAVAVDAPAPPSGAIPSPAGVPGAVTLLAEESGYLQFVDLRGLVADAREAGGQYRLLVSPGSWVQDHAPIGSFELLDDGAADLEARTNRMRDALSVGQERSTQQDVAFGIQQLVDIAVKALSPSINDPTTAMNCIDRLVEVLTFSGLQSGPPRAFADSDDVVRLEIPFPGFDELVRLAFDQVRHYGGDAPAVVIHLARGLSILDSALPVPRHPALTEQALLLAEAAATIELEADRRRAISAVAPLVSPR